MAPEPASVVPQFPEYGVLPPETPDLADLLHHNLRQRFPYKTGFHHHSGYRQKHHRPAEQYRQELSSARGSPDDTMMSGDSRPLLWQ
ncbi:hypothetical protein [Escherichia Stx1 converting phage]|uniref:Uncharacterized protein n=2 Tax=Traversvirus TaxID=1981157 RepID=Q7Y2U9_9CAUD|nr:hypothetical protein Stx1_p033 [Escherichia Stx1 converting phage]NP_859277.1 hypothetical protein Stx2II_p032 [Escherichia phage Stx2 II]BAB87880.1 hypothetical protein [Stx2 converting phage I]BAC77848.1 hypothetical protein [Escherichia Stx1 converting phage]BAC78014.1 hypothetical protein [Escherichia phage Stx2 II]